MSVSVLVVDDLAMMRQAIREVLQENGIKVAGEAHNGKDAIDKINALSKKPDIILMDHRLPMKNGIETTREILSVHKDIKIIFASADNSVKNEALNSGACYFLEKPFSISVLIDKITETLDQL